MNNLGKVWWYLLGIGIILFGIYAELVWGCGAIVTPINEMTGLEYFCSPTFGGMFWTIGLVVLVGTYFWGVENAKLDD